jgi:hypothetical protein
VQCVSRGKGGFTRQNLPAPRQELELVQHGARYTDLAQSSQSLNWADTCKQILELLGSARHFCPPAWAFCSRRIGLQSLDTGQKTMVACETSVFSLRDREYCWKCLHCSRLGCLGRSGLCYRTILLPRRVAAQRQELALMIRDHRRSYPEKL